MLLLGLILAGFALALAAPWVRRAAGPATGWLLALYPTAVFVAVCTSAPAASNVSLPWIPSLGINFALYVDGLSTLFALLISGIGAMVLIYAGTYLHGHPQLGRFFAYLLAFMAAMLGVVLAGNLFLVFVFWELTSITSYLLIGFKHDEEKSRKAALQALLVTGVGGLALLAGSVLLQSAAGTAELAELLKHGRELQGHALYVPIVLLVFAAAFTKSAQTPFHFWLPGAMAAPTPVSAYLHSATMVKAGVYLLARLSPVLGGSELWQYTLLAVGTATMLTGACLAAPQSDLKRLLAYSTVAALGTLVLLIGLDTPLAAVAVVLFLLTHSLYKGALFLVAGAVDHATGTRDIDELGGLAPHMRATTAAALLAGLSMAGIAPFLGFVAKEVVYEAVLQSEASIRTTLIGCAVLINALGLAVAGFVSVRPFFGYHRRTPRKAHEAPIAMLLGPLGLASLGLIFGLAPQPLVGHLLDDAASAIRNAPVEYHIGLWHGLTPALGLTGLTIGAGVLLFLQRNRICDVALRLQGLAQWGPTRAYGAAINGLFRIANVQTDLLQAGFLRRYLLMIVVTTLALTGSCLAVALSSGIPWHWDEMHLHEAAVALVILLGAVTAVRANSRMTAVAALGVVGYGVALIFLLFGGPDLAMTQFAIETLTVLLFVLVLYRLPRFSVRSSVAQRRRDAFVAACLGMLMTLLLLAVSSPSGMSRLATFFASNSLAQAKGRNVVNVILVDFRGLDTLGEITVLAVAAIGVVALLNLKPKREHA